MRCLAVRCMEEMGDWGKVLEVIDLETSEAGAAVQGEAEDNVLEPDDSRLFQVTDTWNGPKYLRCMLPLSAASNNVTVTVTVAVTVTVTVTITVTCYRYRYAS